MIELPAVRVSGGGGGRGRAMRRRGGCLTQRYELQGRVHGPAHQRSKRALVLSAVGHRREHVFVRLRSGSDGKQRNVRDPEGPNCGSRGAKPNHPDRPATVLARRTPNRLRAWFICGSWRRPDRADRVYALLCGHAVGDRRDPGSERLHAARRGPHDVRRRARGRERDHLRARASSACTTTGRSRSARPTRSRTSPTPRSRTRRARPPTPSSGSSSTSARARASSCSGVFLIYMVLAAIIAAIGIFLDSPILVVGRDGRRPGVRPGRRPVRGPRPEARRARPPLGHRARGRLPARDRRDRARHARSSTPPT